ARDLQPGQLLAVALALLVAGLVLVAEDPDLVAAEVLDLLGGDLDLRELVLGGGDLVAVDQQHGSEIDAVARLACHAVDHDGVTDRHLLLTTACADDCVHHVNAPSCDSELLYESSSLPGVTADLRPSTWSGPGGPSGRCGRRCPPGARLRRVLRQGTAYDPATCRSTTGRGPTCENAVTPCGTRHPCPAESCSDCSACSAGSVPSASSAGSVEAEALLEAAAIEAIVARAWARLVSSSSRRCTSPFSSAPWSPPSVSSFAPPRERRPRRREDFEESSEPLPPPPWWCSPSVSTTRPRPWQCSQVVEKVSTRP